jgi:hypothetical protein
MKYLVTRSIPSLGGPNFLLGTYLSEEQYKALPDSYKELNTKTVYEETDRIVDAVATVVEITEEELVQELPIKSSDEDMRKSFEKSLGKPKK